MSRLFNCHKTSSVLNSTSSNIQILIKVYIFIFSEIFILTFIYYSIIFFLSLILSSMLLPSFYCLYNFYSHISFFLLPISSLQVCNFVKFCFVWGEGGETTWIIKIFLKFRSLPKLLNTQYSYAPHI